MDGNTHNGKYKRSGYKSMYRISILRYKMTICLYKIQFTVSSEWLCACIVCVCVSYHKVSILRFQQASLMAFSIDIYILFFPFLCLTLALLVVISSCIPYCTTALCADCRVPLLISVCNAHLCVQSYVQTVQQENIK